MQTLRTLIFTVKVDRSGSATLHAQLSGSLLGVSGEVTDGELEILISYLAAMAARIRQVKSDKGEPK